MYKEKKVLWDSIYEARGRWAPGRTARVCTLWIDTPRQREWSKPCLVKSRMLENCILIEKHI